MNRRGFLKNLGFGAAAVVVAPLVSFVPTPKRMIYKVDLPVFMLFYTADGSNEIRSMAKCVQTFNISLQKLCERHPNDEIFFYQENESIVQINDSERIFKYVRACVIKKDPNIKILADKNYEVL